MSTWIWIFMFLAGGLFTLKITYVLCTAIVLPVTQGAMYVSTSQVRISSFIQAVPMSPGQLLIDLGCGDGRVLRQVQKAYGARTIGYEVNPLDKNMNIQIQVDIFGSSPDELQKLLPPRQTRIRGLKHFT